MIVTGPGDHRNPATMRKPYDSDRTTPSHPSHTGTPAHLGRQSSAVPGQTRPGLRPGGWLHSVPVPLTSLPNKQRERGQEPLHSIPPAENQNQSQDQHQNQKQKVKVKIKVKIKIKIKIEIEIEIEIKPVRVKTPAKSAG